MASRQLPEGYTTWVDHERIIDQDTEEILAYGGSTLVRIVDGEGEVVALAYAECSPVDRFEKKRGIDIALGRAVKQLDEHERLLGRHIHG